MNERYVREWLGAMTTGRILEYDSGTRSYLLPAEHAVCLTGDSTLNVAPTGGMVSYLARFVPPIEQAFRDGGGVPLAAYLPDFYDLRDVVWHRIYDEHLIDGFIGAVAGISERLQAGIRVADVGCGSGHVVNLMARAFPASAFVGYDSAEEVIAKARKEAADFGLTNAHFAVADAAALPANPKFDVITAFDSIHDQVDPAGVIRGIGEALAPNGTFLMVDFKASSNLEDNVGIPYAPYYYALSVLHCMTISLADGGAGLGAMWGEQLARALLAEAGFTRVDVVDSPRPQNAIYICRKS
jgi:SAM-dependent methyltransferase